MKRVNKKIVFDLIPTQFSGGTKYHGGGEYTKVVFKRLVKNKKDAEIICLCEKNKNLDETILEIIRDYHLESIVAESKMSVETVLATARADKFYSALPDYGMINLPELEIIYTIHGLRAIEMPTDLVEIKYAGSLTDYAKYIYKNLCRKKYLAAKKKHFMQLLGSADNIKIITVSLHTKYALLNIIPNLNEKQITMLHSPRVENIPAADKGTLQKLSLKKKEFFLLLNADRWRKNAYRAIRAFDQLYSEHPEFSKKLLVLGAGDRKVPGKIINKGKFVFQGYVDTELLEMFYKDCYCLVYPTLNEGFGYPPLECMKYGTPAICSAITSVAEICQDGVIYFNPFSIEEMKNRILQIEYESGMYEKYSRKGLEVSGEIAKKQDQMLDKLVEIILT